jgi:hypothetical protein
VIFISLGFFIAGAIYDFCDNRIVIGLVYREITYKLKECGLKAAFLLMFLNEWELKHE